MSTIKVDTIATRTGSGNITASNTIAGTSATLSGTLGVTGNTTVGGTLVNTGLITASAGISIGSGGDTNTLDDYEEGTWTATLGGTGSDPTVSSYTYNSGHYTKIGRQVYAHLFMRIENGNISGGSGDGIIRGLPYASKSTGNISYGAGAWIENYWSTSASFSSGRNFPAMVMIAGTNYMRIYQKSTNDPTMYTGWGLTQIDNGAFLAGGVMVYMTDL